MDQDIKARWVAALRSGQYQQTEGYLQTRDGFCCLGVLCEIAVQDGVIQSEVREVHEAHTNTQGIVTYGTEGNTMEAVLPSPVYDWARLDDSNPRVIYDGVSIPISDLNDDEKLNFDQIADVIEEQF